ncbi:unannotated protein [freshwater metagenome]|uniref:Unannotated protein n=1 Tax=freshwater metagenome TaxID=449393 RepID=A0A6J6ASQ1_9ZZZZ
MNLAHHVERESEDLGVTLEIEWFRNCDRTFSMKNFEHAVLVFEDWFEE